MHDQITAVILAGGKARRMDNQDKGLIMLADKPLIKYVIEKTKPQVSDILISANRNIAEYRKFNYLVLSDDLQGFLGPLAGIATALQQCKTDYLLVLPCDCPFLPNNLASQMLEQIKTNDADLCMAYDGNRLQPLISLISRTLANRLINSITAGHLKVERWMLEQKHCISNFTDSWAFMNINTFEDLKQAQYLNQI